MEEQEWYNTHLRSTVCRGSGTGYLTVSLRLGGIVVCMYITNKCEYVYMDYMNVWIYEYTVPCVSTVHGVWAVGCEGGSSTLTSWLVSKSVRLFASCPNRASFRASKNVFQVTGAWPTFWTRPSSQIFNILLQHSSTLPWYVDSMLSRVAGVKWRLIPTSLHLAAISIEMNTLCVSPCVSVYFRQLRVAISGFVSVETNNKWDRSATLLVT